VYRENFLIVPIFVGKKWTDMTTSAPIGGTVEVNYLREFRIEGFEEITTLAGTFKAYKIHYKQTNMSRGANGWILYWYSPEVKNWVKREVENSMFWANVRGLQNAELTSYELK
jgi:hypothetical protein